MGLVGNTQISKGEGSSVLQTLLEAQSNLRVWER